MRKIGTYISAAVILAVIFLAVMANAGDLPSVPLAGDGSTISLVSTEYEVPISLPTSPSTPTTEALQLDKTHLELIYRQKASLTANDTVEWKSSNEAVVTVDQNGNLKASGKGEAAVTATAADGREAVCIVSVRYTWWQLLIRYVLFGWLWY